MVVAALKLAKRIGVPSSAGVSTLPLTFSEQQVEALAAAIGGCRAAAAAVRMADSGCMGVTRTVTRLPSAATERVEAICVVEEWVGEREEEREKLKNRCLSMPLEQKKNDFFLSGPRVVSVVSLFLDLDDDDDTSTDTAALVALHSA